MRIVIQFLAGFHRWNGSDVIVDLVRKRFYADSDNLTSRMKAFARAGTCCGPTRRRSLPKTGDFTQNPVIFHPLPFGLAGHTDAIADLPFRSRLGRLLL